MEFWKSLLVDGNDGSGNGYLGGERGGNKGG